MRTDSRLLGRTALFARLIALILALASETRASIDAETCEAGKQKLATKYLACLNKAENAQVLGGTPEGYDAAVAECEARLANAWDSLEAKAEGSCPSIDDDEEQSDFLHACIAGLTRGLSGDRLPLDPITCSASVPICQSTLASCQSDPPAATRKTGQTDCYDALGLPIACAGTGHDGETQLGSAPSYNDNGNGTVTDTVTGLMWEKLDDSDLPGVAGIHDYDADTLTWEEALARIDTLNASTFAGFTDWRLPTIRELMSLIDLGRSAPATDPVFHTGCVPGCTSATCSCTGNIYWTSSPRYIPFYFPDSRPLVWTIYFADGFTYSDLKNAENRVRAVRTAS